MIISAKNFSDASAKFVSVNGSAKTFGGNHAKAKEVIIGEPVINPKTIPVVPGPLCEDPIKF